jgi:polyhydroxybutyrate depolymerase
MGILVRILTAVVALGLAADAAAQVMTQNEGGALRRRLQERQERQQETPQQGERGRSAGRGDQAAHGLERGTLQSGGIERSYYLSVPQTARGGRLPLVLVFHGGQGSGARIAQSTEFHEVGQRQGFAVAYPEAHGEDKVWNDGRKTSETGINDVGFIDDLIAALSSRYQIDRNKIYATGLSSGGMFTIRLACERSDKIKAFAPVSANLPVDLVPRCRPGRAVPIEFFHGTDDKLMPWNGGEIPAARTAKHGGGKVISTPETVKFWVQNDGCTGQPQESPLPDTDPNDGTRVSMVKYPACRDSAEVVQYKVQGGGHTWPGSPVKPASKVSGLTSKDIRATDTVWAFFQKH